MDLDFVEAKLQEAGEIHLVVEEHEAVISDSDSDYIGLRKHNTSFDHENEVLFIDDGTKKHAIGSDRIIYWHAPTSFPD